MDIAPEPPAPLDEREVEPSLPSALVPFYEAIRRWVSRGCGGPADIAAAAAERRRRRRQLRKDSSSRYRSDGAGSAAEPSEGEFSEESSQLDATGPAGRGVDANSRVGGGTVSGSGPFGREKKRVEYGGNLEDESGSAAEEGHSGVGGIAGTGRQGRPLPSAASTQSSSCTTRTPAATSPGILSTTTSAAVTTAAAAAASAEEGEVDFTAVDADTPFPQDENDAIPAARAAPRQSQHPEQRHHRHLHEAPEQAAGGEGAPGKEDGSVWSDKGTMSSPAPSPQGRGNLRYGDHSDHGSDRADVRTRTPQQRPSPLSGGFTGATAGMAARGGGGKDGDEEEGEEGRDWEEGERRTRAASIMASNASMHVHDALSPATTPFGRLKEHQPHQQQQQHQRQDRHKNSCGGSGGSDSGSGQVTPASVTASTHSALSPRAAEPFSAAVGGGSGGGIGGTSARERRGFGGLLGMGGNNVGGQRGKGGRDDAEVGDLKAEAEELRAEVEELSLELEDADDRLRGQEAELKTVAQQLKRQKAAAAEREQAMEAEMEEFRVLQLEEKKVFLANLEQLERTVKDREREADEARSALASLEAFAIEREDTVTRLTQEKKELLEELEGARSGQDRSAEEVREALTRAEAEAEEVEARHRSWMRQAQARQTELEATAAQLAEALAEANRKHQQQQQQQSATAAGGGMHGNGEGSRHGGVEGGVRARAADRELRALHDELDSSQASLELEQERARSLQQEVSALRHDLDAARAAEAVAERQMQEHSKMAAESLAKVARLEQQLQHEKARANRLGASVPLPSGPESQIQALSSKLLDKHARLEESVRARTALSAKLKEATHRAFRAEQELRELLGESLEAGGVEGDGAGLVRPRRGRQDRSSLGRTSTGSWSRLAPIAKHKKIASVVDVLDRQTLQGVVFLRSSSMARAVFLAYLLLIHIWAFAVLSIHSSHLDHMKHPATLSGNENHGHD